MTPQPSPTNLSDELENILDDLVAPYTDFLTEKGLKEVGKDIDDAKAAITAAYAEAIRSAVPEKLTEPPEDCSGKDYSLGQMAGHNAVIDEVTKQLTAKGLL